MKIKCFFASLVIALFISGCITYTESTPHQESNDTNDTNVSSSAMIIKTTPDQNETNISLTTVINVTFDKVLDSATLVTQNIGFYRMEVNGTNSSTSILMSDYNITPYTTGPYGFTIDYNTTLGLDKNTTYEVNVTTAVQDYNKQPLKAQGFSFTTVAN